MMYQNEIALSDWKKYLNYGDYRINFAAVGYALQTLFFFITEGDPFCNDINCRLYNAHWQEELIQSQIQNKDCVISMKHYYINLIPYADAK